MPAEELKSGSKSAEEELFSDNKYLLFKLLNEPFCVDIGQLSCISYPQKIQIVPMAKKHVMGVVSLRGQLAVQIDLAKKYSIYSQDSHEIDCLLYVETSSGRMAIPVHEVVGVLTVQDTDILKDYPKPYGVPEDLIKGALRSGETLYLLLDIVKSLDEIELTTISETIESAKN